MDASADQGALHRQLALLRTALVAGVLVLGGVAHAERYQFELTKGAGVDVCDSYVRRLNQSEFVTLPHCDRPEDDRVAGFEKLNRVPLSYEEVVNLYPRVEGLITFNDVDHYTTVNEGGLRDAREAAEIHRRGVDLGATVPLVYRFDPRVDIDNDGRADDVVVWKPALIGCNSLSDASPEPNIAETHLVVLDDTGALDEPRTRAIFGHPAGTKITYADANGREVTLDIKYSFRTVGQTFGVFSFHGRAYFDTFYGGLGDLQNERVDAPGIGSTLAVMRRAEGKTTLICELSLPEYK